MGVDVPTFNFLLFSGFGRCWNEAPIPRADVSAFGEPRLGRRSLDAAGGLGLVLHWLRSSTSEIGLMQVFALVSSVLHRYLQFGLDTLLQTLRRMADARITWPSERRMTYYSRLIRTRHPLIDGAFGFMDGLSLPVTVSADPQVEKATYNGWLHTHKVSNIFVFAPDGTIIAATLNAPGSWHDARVAHGVYPRLINNTPEDHFLIADSAFPRTSQVLRAKIRTPFKANAALPQDPEQRAAAILYSNALVSARQAAEWGMRSLQGAFGRLKVPLDINDPDGRMRLLEIVTRLHNLRTRLVGINQIRTVYMQHWRRHGGGQGVGNVALPGNGHIARFYYRFN
ncbi:hypothetical protein FRC09_012793 [Ceratobasidium sp. 395]|nr:hypothetical protein FRC09_012793 [Ceratobasidium sp. 395]